MPVNVIAGWIASGSTCAPAPPRAPRPRAGPRCARPSGRLPGAGRAQARDDALRALVAGLSATGAWQAGQMAVHTSGRHGVAVLEPAPAHGVLPLALHPAMTFTGTAMDLDRLTECAFGVTAPTSRCGRSPRRSSSRWAASRCGWPRRIGRLYHAALAHGANHLVTLVSRPWSCCRGPGSPSPRQVVGPLLRAALDNALRLGDAALTGPVARGDVGTVEDHLRELDRLSPEIRRPTSRSPARPPCALSTAVACGPSSPSPCSTSSPTRSTE